MGVDLRDIVTLRKIDIESLNNKVIAIDAYNSLYQFLAIIRGERGELLMDRHGNITSHISGLFYRNINFLSIGIKPIYIFDGQPPELKAMEIEKRKEFKEKATIMYMRALAEGRIEEAKKYAQATSLIKDYMVEDAKKVLDLLGIPWIVAPSEGEATAAQLSVNNLAYACASQDYDSLLFGAKRLIRNLTISGRRKLPGKKVYIEIELEEILLEELLNQLSITREQLIDIGILVGTDFNPDGFKGIGPKSALKLIREYKRLESIPEIQEELKKIDYQAIREIFLKPKVSLPEKIEFKSINKEGLIHFLCDEKDFSFERVNNAISKLEETLAKRSLSLDRFF
ncbi:MAG: flap endonuclease-1 [Nitrososphaerales archaeon]